VHRSLLCNQQAWTVYCPCCAMRMSSIGLPCNRPSVPRSGTDRGEHSPLNRIYIKVREIAQQPGCYPADRRGRRWELPTCSAGYVCPTWADMACNYFVTLPHSHIDTAWNAVWHVTGSSCSVPSGVDTSAGTRVNIGKVGVTDWS
jgi:hypothetical protein